MRIGFLITFLAYAVTSIVADNKIICYYGSWATYRPGIGQFNPTDIDPKLCTHIVYTFVGIYTDGRVYVLDSWNDLPSGKNGFGKFTSLRQLNPNVTVLVGMGGWNEGSYKYSQVAGNPAVRAKFVQNMVAFLKMYNFDGLDLDWSFPNQRGGVVADRENYITLLKELRQEFDKNGYNLSVTVSAPEYSASASYIIPEIIKYVDYISLMTYDLHGTWEKVALLHSGLYPSGKDTDIRLDTNVDWCVKYWLTQGASVDKIILGIPAHGRSFTLSNSTNNQPGAPILGVGNPGPYSQEGGILAYNEICEFIKSGWTVERDSKQRVPYAYQNNQWVGYDDVTSVEEKVNYAKSKGLAGVMLWGIENDDFRGLYGEKYPLLNAINKAYKEN